MILHENVRVHDRENAHGHESDHDRESVRDRGNAHDRESDHDPRRQYLSQRHHESVHDHWMVLLLVSENVHENVRHASVHANHHERTQKFQLYSQRILIQKRQVIFHDEREQVQPDA